MSQAGKVPLRHRLSLRLRITLFTTALVAVIVAVGGLLILAALRSELVDAADDAGKERAEQVAAIAAEGALPTPLPGTGQPETFVEVVANGSLVTATEGLDKRSQFDVPEQPVDEVDVSQVDRLPIGESGPFRVITRGVDTPSGPMTVLVAVSVEDVHDTMAAATKIGTIGLSIVVLALASVMWLAVGRALAPVEAIRTRADAITAQSLASRVPESANRDEISRLARTVNRMLGRLQVGAEQQRRFVADAAHELRSPIASLRVQLETARDGNGVAGREDDLLHETTRMESLVEQLLLLARADADAPWLRLSAVDLDDVVESAVGSAAADGPVTIDVSAVEPVQVSGDAVLLEQVVRNLVHNAVRHAREVVRVSVTATEDGTAVVTVDDDGPGVPEESREDIFGRFVRIEDSRQRDRGGVGLGLAIVTEIVSAHAGRVHVTDSPLGGARFSVELPIENSYLRAST